MILAITSGDVNGVGIELTIKLWLEKRHNFFNQGIKFVLLANICDVKYVADVLGYDIKLTEVNKDDLLMGLDFFLDSMPVMSIMCNDEVLLPNFLGYNPLQAVKIVRSIDLGISLAKDGLVAGLVTNPIVKRVFEDANIKGVNGHTDYLASFLDNKDAMMMLANDILKVALLTIHIPLREVFSYITKENILDKVLLLNNYLKTDCGIANPRIAIAGLNPHAGEDGKLGMEEVDVIYPAIYELKAAGVNITGCYAPDTMFIDTNLCNYDVAFCMYHDQGLIPIKTLGFYSGVNITLGLSIVRTSPDHGTAFEIAGKGVAEYNSLYCACIEASKIIHNRNKE